MYEYTNVLFERGLGFVNLVAFLSYYVQLLGLVGEHGLLPAKSTLHNLRNRPMMLAQRFGLSLRSPTEPKKVDVDTFLNNFSVFWFGASDRMLRGVCLAGVVASSLATLGWFTPIMIAVCSVCYLSLMTVGQTFFMFQWDSFLLECNGLYIFTTPLRWYSPWVLSFAGRILVARLLLSSGVVKTTSGCEKWRSLTALHYHYWTQPLPNILAVYAHRLPDWFHRMSVVMTVFLQVFVPWLCFGPGQYIRAFAFVFMCKMQAVIAVTGNYGFFNILSLVACIPILDDYAWRTVMPSILQPDWLPPIEGNPLSVFGWGMWSLSAAVSAVFLFFYAQLQLVPLASCARVSAHGKMQDIFRWLQNYNLINRYGLFASMTTFRKELIIEGSEDGENWEEYEFYHKPGNPFKKPPNLPFHMPRVDWRLWFIPLGSYFPHTDPPTWYLSLLSNLLLGNPTVSALLEFDPFRGHPPKYIRTRVYHFVFAHSAPNKGKRFGIPESLPNHCLTRRDFEAPKADQWWYRELLQGAYGPIVTKQSAEVITNSQHETAERFEPMPVRETFIALWKSIDWKELWTNTKEFPVKDVAQHSWRTLRDILWFCKRLLQIEIAATKKLAAERWGTVWEARKRAAAAKAKEPMTPMTPVATPKSP